MPLPDSQSTELSEATAVPFLPLAVVGMECRFPGASNLAAYEQLLFDGRHGFGPMPADRLDRSLYFDSQKGTPGKTYTDLGGCVSEERLDPQLLEWCGDNVSRFDPVHLNFTDIVLKAWQKAGFRRGDPRWKRTGVYVGHSGATQNGGRLNLATCIEDGLDYLNEIPAFQALPEQVRKRSLREVVSAIRVTRPRRNSRNLPRLNGYTAASLPAILLGLEGPRVVCDAACASSLFSLQQAAMAIRQGRLDAAIVGGATTNGVDNLILFSQSQACSEKGSRPFDEGASGLISSEGYAAVVLVPLATAEQMQLPVLGVLTGLGTASDGRGKSLWAPRAEGQQLAIRRAYPADQPLNIDYLEAHATSTQLGDATELHAVHSILNDQLKDRKTNGSPLLIGSAKSNLGHTLETAGIAGLIKILLAMKRREIPPSLQFERPNTNFDWTAKTIEVVDRCRPWTPRGNVRRSAVSAFGIGGLNAHLTVEEPDSIRVRSLERGVSPVQERIAIVGRGVVLPGGHNLEQFRQLLESGKSVIGPAPPDRWRPGIGLSSSEPRLPFTSPTNQGGYIRDYVFDAQPYRIPPKQVKQSNPIQMMLLDAVTQAIQERDGGTWKLDRQRAGVVIGTVFGGDFGSQLQLGLRLPEIHRELKRHLLSQGVPEQQIEELFKQYRQRVLSERPALLDETGSFTASTLASRVAKTFDLMGGACAIDVDDASGLAGIQLAVDQLRCGHWELAICGAADRSLDLMKFEQLDLQGRLVRSGRVEDIPDDCRQVLPGEGVVVLMLQRLSDALEKKLPILGIIDDVALSSMQEPVTSDAALVRQIGYLTGAQSLVSLIKETLNWERSPRNTKPVCSEESQIVQIQSQAEDHQTYTVRCSSPVLAQSIVSSSALLSDQRVTTLRQPAQNLFTDTIEQRTVEQRKSTSTAAGTPWMDSVSGNRNLTTGYVSTVISQVDMSQNGFHSGSELDLSGSYSFRFSDRSLTGLIAQLEQAVIGGTSAFQRKPTRFAPDQEYRLGLLAGSPEQLESRLTAVLKQLRSGRQSGVFETERAVLWRVRPQATRTAWVFPGQGSQYHELPSGLVAGSLVEQELQRFDAELQQLGLEPLLPKLTNGTLNTRDIWWNQVWVLGLSLSLASVLKQFARKPDVVLGHSFGEYAALVTAGALTVPQVLRMVRARSNAVTMTVRDPGQLISVRGAPTQVDAVLKASGLPYQTTHFNAPQQTVVATSLDQVSAIRETLNTANLASIPVPVPVAYHTSRLADAEELLKQSFAQERFLPATCPVLSATTARYLVEPSDLRTSLVSQMTRPVLYVPAVERLLDSETAAFIEVGPNNVLSRLNQDITGQNALCLSLDVPGKDHAERVQLIRLVQEIIEPCPQSEPLSISLEIDTAPEANGPALRNGNISRPPVEQKPFEQKPAEPEIEIVDLRRVGNKTRESVKADDAEPASATQVPVFAPTPVTVTSPVATPVPVTVAASAAVSAEEVRQFLKTVVVDLTGYSPDVVDFDADLEADLGVDSIKKAQVVGEMAEQYSLDMAPSGVKLGDLKTLDDIARIGMLALSSSGTAPSESASS
ncbi:MAG TPA: beta-ketoacyl synthase N-terminal-like domain-containing protein, partial [Planctomicrobium sp.]|nr:beta-ketoacyl synthase N-terminal-like domain-containing protein [Planctomicrobium sp.]